jgi:hypothetical protein
MPVPPLVLRLLSFTNDGTLANVFNHYDNHYATRHSTNCFLSLFCMYCTVGERDAFMAEAVGSSPGKNLVGVVGMAHMGGIENYLVANKGFSVVKRNCPPTK